MNKVFHNLLSIFIPYFGICTVYSYIFDLFPQSSRLGFLEFAVVLIVGLLCQFVFSITRKERVGAFSYVRMLIFMYLIFWGILLLINKGSIKERSVPTFGQVILIVMLAFQYLWSMYLSKLLLEHEQFILFCKDYKGNELFSKLREQGDVIVSSSRALDVSVILSFLPPLFVVLLSLIIGRDLHPVSGSTILFSSVSSFFSAVTFSYVSLTKDERLYAGQGLQTIFEKSRDRFKYSLIIIALCALSALLFAHSDALFVENGQTPFYILLIKWLLNILSSRQRKAADVRFEGVVLEESSGEAETDFETPFYDAEHINLTWLGEALKMLAISVLVITLLIAFFGPFINKDWRDFWRQGKLWKYIKQMLADFKLFLKGLLSGARQEKKPLVLSDAAKKLAGSFKEFAHLKKSKEKKAEIGRLSKKYVELCIWGENAGSPCTKATAPAEYAQQLFKHIGWYKKELSTISELFEKALFSSSLLTSAEEQTFYELIETVVSLNCNSTKEVL